MTTLKKLALAALFAAPLGFATTSPASAHGQQADGGWGAWSPCMMGPGMMGPGMMGPGMMGPGMMGPGMMGPGMMGPGMMGPGMMGPGMMGPGMMGPGMMGPGMMGPGMMGPGMGPGMMGPGTMGPGMGMAPGYGVPQQAEPMSADDVTKMFEQHLAWMGNPKLKVGSIAEKDADTVTVEIVTQDGSLVQRYEVDRRTGFSRPVS